jgi:hypothetical protein
VIWQHTLRREKRRSMTTRSWPRSRRMYTIYIYFDKAAEKFQEGKKIMNKDNKIPSDYARAQ